MGAGAAVALIAFSSAGGGLAAGHAFDVYQQQTQLTHANAGSDTSPCPR
jgi:hypothetical protein